MPPTLLRPLALALLISPLLAAPAAAESPPADERPSARAEAVADRVAEALGGEAAWEAARYLTFGFAERRRHWWDRYTGLHRVEGTNRDGEQYVVVHDVDDRGRYPTDTARAWVAGAEVAAEKAADLVKSAYGAWVNDTYWLLAPYKLRDPGVRLSHGGTETIGGTAYDKLHLTFGDVGLTPGDQYWLYVHPETGEIARWSYVLEGDEPPATVWEWREWGTYGPGIRLSAERVQPESGRVLRLDGIAVPESLPEGIFTRAER